MENDELDKILRHVSGTDLSRLALPKNEDLDRILGNNDFQKFRKSMQEVGKDISDYIAVSGFGTNIALIAKQYKEHFEPQIESFKRIQSAIQPLLFQQSKYQEHFSNFRNIISPSLSLIDTITSYNSYAKYQEIFTDYGGSLDLENFSQEDIKLTIEENREVIETVNQIVLDAENRGLPHYEITELIFAQIQKYIPNINSKYFAILILIFMLALHSYELYLPYSTDKAVKEEVVPRLIKQTEMVDKILIENKESKIELQKIEKDLKSIDSKISTENLETRNELNKIKKDLKLKDDKIEILIDEMKKTEGNK